MNGNTSKTTRSSASEGQQELPVHNSEATSEIKRQLLDAVWGNNNEQSLRAALGFMKTLKR